MKRPTFSQLCELRNQYESCGKEYGLNVQFGRYARDHRYVEASCLSPFTPPGLAQHFRKIMTYDEALIVDDVVKGLFFEIDEARMKFDVPKNFKLVEQGGLHKGHVIRTATMSTREALTANTQMYCIKWIEE